MNALPIAADGVREQAERILGETASPALRVRLLRKVLRRGDFGLCVAWPKTHWSRVAEPGRSCTI